MSGGGSSGKNYYGFGKRKGGRKGDPIIWEGPLGPDSFPDPVFEFPPQHKSEFTNETCNTPVLVLALISCLIVNQG